MAPTVCWVSPVYVTLLSYLLLSGTMLLHAFTILANAPVLRVFPHFLNMLLVGGSRILQIRLALFFFSHYIRHSIWMYLTVFPVTTLLSLFAPTHWPSRKPPWRLQRAFPANWMILSAIMICPTWSHLIRLGIDPTTVQDCLPARMFLVRPLEAPYLLHAALDLLHSYRWSPFSPAPQPIHRPSGFDHGCNPKPPPNPQNNNDTHSPVSFLPVDCRHPRDLHDFSSLYCHSELREYRPHTLPSVLPTCLQSMTPSFDPNFIACLRSQRDIPDSPTVPVILDTGCSFAVTFSTADFVGEPIYQDWGSITTANGSAKIVALGMVEWTVMLANGQRFPLRVPCHLVPDCTHRLLSPQDYCRYHQLPTSTSQFGGDSTHMWLNLKDAPAPLTCPVDPRSHLPVFLAEPKQADGCACSSCHTCFVAGSFNVLGPHNANLTPAQKALLFDHQRLGHVHMAHLQRLYTPFPLDTPHQGEPCLRAVPRSITTCEPPSCASCHLAKSRRQPTHAKRTADVPSRVNITSTDQLVPGHLVSVDHYESSVRGRLPNTRGREREHQQFMGGTIFYDHASHRISVHHQPSLGGSDTLRSKLKYEQDCRRYGIEVQRYHTDNGIFTAESFLQALENERQTIEVSGVGAHHQNPCAERAIQTVVYMARTMLIHAKLHWPDEFDIKLWPFALDYACWIHNHLPDK